MQQVGLKGKNGPAIFTKINLSVSNRRQSKKLNETNCIITADLLNKYLVLVLLMSNFVQDGNFLRWLTYMNLRCWARNIVLVTTLMTK